MTDLIFAIMIVLLPGMDKPLIQKIPVETVEQCQATLGEMFKIVQKHAGEEQKVMVACQIDLKKSDPA